MIVSIHQPDYIPYLGYFYKIAKSDAFIFLDDAQYSSDNMHQWNRIKTPQGECRIKIPVEYQFGDFINQVRTKDELKWKEKQLKTIKMNYSKAIYFDEVFPEFEQLIKETYTNLADMNITINKWISRKFDFKTEFYNSSQMGVHAMREKRVIDLCVEIGADTYISGNGAKAYQIEDHFTERNVKLQYTEFQSVKYTQLWGDFIPNLSVMDYIFNNGFDFEKVVNLIEGK